MNEVIIIGGELCFKVAKVYSDRSFIRPDGKFGFSGNDLSMMNTDKEYLHICGENDWGYLAVELLKPLLQEANKLYIEISSQVDNLNPEVILVGKNDFRLLDILHTVRDSEFGISVIKGVPVVKGDFLNGVKYLGKKEYEGELPFC